MLTHDEIYTYIESRVNTVEHPVYCASQYEPILERLPACYIYQVGLSDLPRYTNFDFDEKVKRSVWEVEVYTNTADDSGSEAREIMDTVTTAFRGLYYLQTFCSPSPNIDSTIYRLVARFERILTDETITI